MGCIEVKYSLSFLCEGSTFPLCLGVKGLISLCSIPSPLSFFSNWLRSSALLLTNRLVEFSDSENLICYFIQILFAIGLLNEFLLQGRQFLVNTVYGSCLRSADNCGNVELPLRLIVVFITKHLIDGFDDGVLKNQLVDGSGVAFQSSGFF